MIYVSSLKSAIRSSILLIAALGLGALPSTAQSNSGTITGSVVNADSGQAVPGATVSLSGFGRTTLTDLNGTFRLDGVPASVRDLTITKADFQPANVSAVAIANGGITRVDVPLGAAANPVLKMEAFSVAADVVASSNLGLLAARQKSVAVSDSIGGEQFSQLALGTAADAMTKVTGASLVDGKYVVIRGLGDRYTNTQMNGSTLPSADPDRRAVQLDQFPSDLLESITTLKSFTPDQPGAFSGGSVNLKTKSFPESFFITTSFSSAYNTNVAGKDILTVPGSGKDWQGRDDGTRALASTVPNPIPSNLTTTTAQLAARQGDFGPAQELDAISQGFHNAPFFPVARKGRPGFGFSTSFGDSLRFGRDQVFGYIASVKYDRTSEHFKDGVTGRYVQGSVNPQSSRFVEVSRVFTPDLEAYKFAALYQANPDVPGGAPAFGVTRSAENVDWGAYLQLAWRPTLNQEFTATAFHNHSARDQVKRGIGEATRSDSGGEFRENYDLLYTERGVRSLQLAGRTNFPDWNDAALEWRGSFSRSTQEQPDYRSLEFKWSFVLQEFDPSGLNNYRYFRDLQEESADYAVDFSRTFAFAGGREFTLKTGGAYFGGDRTNRERAFVIQSPSARTRPGIESFPGAVGITAQTANSVTFGTVMREITANLNYDGEQTFSAGYVMGEVRMNEAWRFIAGARLERTEIQTAPLPAVGLTV